MSAPYPDLKSKGHTIILVTPNLLSLVTGRMLLPQPHPPAHSGSQLYLQITASSLGDEISFRPLSLC